MRALLLCSALALAACGSSDPASPADAATDLRPADVAPSDVAPDLLANDAAPDVAADTAPDAPDAPEKPAASRDTCNPLAVTAECLPPFPSDFLTRADPSTPTGRRLALPRGALMTPPGTTPIDMAPFNRADGWPTSMPVLVHLGAALREADLTDIRHPERSVAADNPIALFDVASGRRVPFLAEMDANARDPARAALIVRPLEPLAFGARHVVVIRRAVRTTAGAEPAASPGFVALRDRTPSSDPRIEAARPRYEEIFTFLAAQGFARADVLLAWDYTTASRAHVLNPILSMREEVFRRAGSSDGIPFTVARVAENPNARTARIVYGTFTPPNFLRADNSLEFAADGRAVAQEPPRSYPFTMVIPARARSASGPLPLAVFGHGVFGRGEDYLAGDIGRDLLQPLADELGVVLVATDWIGLSGDDLSLLVSQVVPNINRITLVTDRLLQSLVNNLALTEIATAALARDPMVRVNAGALIDPMRVYYYGVSLGGIQGSSLFSVSRHISRGVVSVPGASWSNLLPRSTVYGPIKTFVDARYPDPLLQAQFLGLLQVRFDHTDGINLARLAFRDPLPDAPRDRRLVLQEAIGDCQVPNLTTRMLARAFGARQLTPAVEPAFGLTGVTSLNEPGAALAQYALRDRLMRYTPPDTNTIPAEDNGTHSNSVSEPAALEQVRALINTGMIVQRCDGPCDPG
ncbi:MAG: hypothetical protein U0324_02500 [Polyangiales bacterium]